MNKLTATASSIRKRLGARERVRILFGDQLNLARGKYVPVSESQKGHARMCVGNFAVTYDRDAGGRTWRRIARWFT
jgi:glutamine synthetase